MGSAARTLMVLVAYAIPMLAYADNYWTVLIGPSWHSKGAKSIDSDSAGLGVAYDFGQQRRVGIAGFQNSRGQGSTLLLGEKVWMYNNTWGSGLIGGTVYGYERGWEPLVAATLLARISTKSEVVAALLPPSPSHQNEKWVVNIQFRFRL